MTKTASLAVAIAVLSTIACTGTATDGASGAPTNDAVARSNVDACALLDTSALNDAVQPERVAFVPGERYPASHACVWWSASLPAYSVHVALTDDEDDVVVRVHRHDGRGSATYLPAPSRRVRAVLIGSR
jgi:hypothetical protein